MTAVTYVGPLGAVDLYLPDGSYVTVAHGASADVPAELAEQLRAQPSNWTVPAKDPPKNDGKPPKSGDKE